jgi:hypothetical protein
VRIALQVDWCTAGARSTALSLSARRSAVGRYVCVRYFRRRGSAGPTPPGDASAWTTRVES